MCAGASPTRIATGAASWSPPTHRGTVLLDEIGEMGMRMQTLLMRFLHKHDCHLPIQPFRMLRDLPPPAPGAADAPTITSREN